MLTWNRSDMRPSAPCLAALLLGCFLATTFGPAWVMSDTMRSINDPKAANWTTASAGLEVGKDIKSLLEVFDQQRPGLVEIKDKFIKNRNKGGGIRKLAIWGTAFARLYELPGTDYKEEMYERMVDMADLLLSTRETTHSYIENRVMRGWPMYLYGSDDHPTYEGFNMGNIAMAIAHAARATAMRGEQERAAKMLTPVLEALYDGFFTVESAKSKLDSKWRLVYVPARAPANRKARHRKSQYEKSCLGSPQAYNHGLLVARAAMATLRAMWKIRWSSVGWPMDEWTMLEARGKLGQFTRMNARWLRDGMKAYSTGEDKRDNYPGKDGVTWLQWNYRDMSSCDTYKGTYKDRPEDIAHATYEVNFITELRDYVKEGTPGAVESDLNIFALRDVRSLMVTFLNRIVHDYSGKGGDRFACDVTGLVENSNWGETWKQCGRSRDKKVRALFGPAWLPLAVNAKAEWRKDSGLECDALTMVDTVLPMTIPDNKNFDETNFHKISSKWAPYAIEAKYHFYNFKALLDKDCYEN